MSNSGIRGKRAKDSTGKLSLSEKFVQSTFPVPTITSFSVQGLDDTALDPDGGQTVVLTGKNFESGATVVVGGASIAVVTVVNSTTITFTSPAKASGSYTVFVTNPNGGTAILTPGLVYSGLPTFITEAGSLGSYYETTTIDEEVVATEGEDPITYSVISGSLPAGATMYSNGTITGTAPAESDSTTYTFTVQATDAEDQDSTREFSLTINVDVVTWSSPADQASISLDGNEEMANVTLSATSAAGYDITYEANVLPIGVSLANGVVSGTPNTEQTVTTLLTATANTTNRTATRTVTWVVSLGDTFFNQTSLVLNADDSTFITDASTNAFDLTPNGDVRPSAFSPYNGGWSNYFDGSGDYLSTTQTTFAFGTNSFTIQGWIYPISGTTTAGSGGVPAFFSTTAGSNANYSIELFLEGASSTGSFRLVSNASGSWAQDVASPTGLIKFNTWQHIAVVRDGGTITLYYNGVAVGTKTGAASYNYQGTAAKIGYMTIATSSGHFKGYMSDVRVINGIAITPSILTSPLTAISGTSLLTCQSNQLVDKSPNNFAITKNGDVKVTSFGPFSTNYRATPESYSVYFDGTDDIITVTGNGAGPVSTQNFTFECWMYVRTYGGNYPRIFEGVDSNAFQVYLSNGTLIYGRNGGGTILSYGVSSLTNSWYHVCITRSGDTHRLFIDGVLRAYSASNTASMADSATWRSACFAGGIVGCVSNIRIVRGSVLSDYVTSSSTTGASIFVPPTTPLEKVTGTSFLSFQSSTLVDNSDNDFPITSGAQAQPIAANPFDGSPLTYSGYFDGSGDYLTVASSADFAFDGDFTIEHWAYFADLSVQRNIWDMRVSTGNETKLAAYFDVSTGKYKIYSDAQDKITSTETITANTWYHFALVRNGSTVTLYVNGTASGSTWTTSTSFGNAPMLIGARYDGANSVKGYISNFRVVKGSAIVPSSGGPTVPLTAVSGTSLLTCQSPSFIDTNTQTTPKTITVTNAVVSTVNPLGYNEITQTAITDTTGSGYFDGTGDYLTVPDNDAFDLPGDFTAEFFVYATAGNARRLFQLGDQRSSYNGLLIYSTTGNLIVVYVNGTVVITGPTLVPYQWVHVACVREGTGSNNLKLYVNGSLAGQVTNTVSFTGVAGNGISLGAEYNGSFAATLETYISDFRLVKGTAVYTSNFLPPATPLTSVTNTSLLTLQHRVSYNNSQPIDTSGQNNVISRFGNASVGAYSPFVPSGWSGYFDRSADFLSTSHSSAFALSGQDFTIEAWIYLDQYSASYNGAYSSALCGSKLTNGQSGFEISIGGNASSYTGIGFAAKSSGTFTVNVSASYSFQLHTWYHVSIVKSGSTYTFYVDGSSIGSATNANGWTNLTVLYVGSINVTGYQYYFPGYISNFRIVKGTAIVPPSGGPTAPLEPVTGTSILTLRGNSLEDDGPNRLAITRNGDTKITPFSPFKPHTRTPGSYSVYFDGNGDSLTLPLTTELQFGTGDYTFECWVYAFSLSATKSGEQVLLTCANNGFLVSIWNQNIHLAQDFVADKTDWASSEVTSNSWFHLTITRSGTDTKCFVNGTQAGSTYTDSSNYTGTTTVYIGRHTGGTLQFSGYLSNLRLVKGTSITPPSGGPTAPLTAVSGTQLLTCQSPTIIDNSTNEFAITVNGNSQPTKFNPFGETVTTGVEYSPTTHGGSVYFDGTGDYLGTNYSINWSTLGAYTIEFWVYHASLSAFNQTYLSTGSTGYTNFYNYSDGRVGLGIQGTNEITTASGAITANTWHHITYTYDGTTTRIYIDGVLRASGTTAVYSNNTAALQIANGLSTQPVFGYMSSVRIVRGTRLYTSAFVPPAAPADPIAGSTLLINGTNAAIQDKTGRNVLETVGNARVVNGVKKYGSGAMYFDGTGDYLLITQNTGGILLGTSPFTIEFWFSTTSSTRYASFISNEDTNGFTILINNASATSGDIAIYNGASGLVNSATGTSYRDGGWHHLAFVRDSSGSRLYINGTQQGSTTASQATTTFDATGAFRWVFGANLRYTGRDYIGYIDDLRITKGVARTITVPTSTYKLK